MVVLNLPSESGNALGTPTYPSPSVARHAGVDDEPVESRIRPWCRIGAEVDAMCVRRGPSIARVADCTRPANEVDAFPITGRSVLRVGPDRDIQSTHPLVI
jgi:hypothetical protein